MALNLRIAPLLSSSAGLIDAWVSAKDFGDFSRRVIENYTGYVIAEKKWDFARFMRGAGVALVGNGVAWGARTLGFQGRVISTRRVKVSVF